ncbi:MAG: O-antigen/teichoic acid export membrane protein [Salibacteraceae bacterium]|jgi:O-antigen/teichoic acid export membrane protein
MIRPYIAEFIGMLKKVISLARVDSFDTTTKDGRSNERYRRVLLTAGSSAAHKGITVLTGLISIPLTVGYLGAERYGLWMTITTVLAFISFADLGLGNGLLNALARSHGLNKEKFALTAVSSAFYMLTGISFTLGCVFVIGYSYIPWDAVFNVKSEIAISEAGPTVFVLVMGFLINMPLGIIHNIQVGYQEGYKNQLWLAVGALLGLAGVLLVIFFEAGLPWLVLAFVGGPLLAMLLNGLFLFIGSKPWLFPRISQVDFTVGRKLAGIGVVFLFLQLFTIIGNSIDNIVIAQLLGASAVASYAITKKLFLIIQIGQFFISPLWPAFGEAMARGEYEWIKETIYKTLRLSIGIGGLVTLPFLIFGKEIIFLWVGEEYVPSFYLILGFFVWAMFTNYGGTMSVFLNNDSLVRKQLWFVALSSVSSVFLQVLLCSLIGIEGIVLGMILSYCLFYVVPAYKLTFGTLDSLIISSQGK